MLKAIVFGLVVVTTGCAADDDSSSGQDSLPKRGERTSDPTIVSAVAECENNFEGYEPFVKVTIQASDPMGASNLSGCSATIGSVAEQGEFYPTIECSPAVTMDCQPHEPVTVAIVVSNATGGVTTASVELVMSTD